MNWVNLQMNMKIRSCISTWPAAVIWLCGILWLLLGLPGVVQGQAKADSEWALSVHNRVRQHYIRQDTAQLQQLTDSICAIQPATAMTKGACAECRGFGYLLYKQFEPAWKAYERAAGYFAQANYPYLRAQALNNAGWAADRSNQQPQALALYQQGEKVLTENAADRADRLLLCHLYSNLIDIYGINGDYTMVFNQAVQMLKLAEQIPDTGRITSALESLMTVYRKFGETANAQKYHDQLCRIYETPGKNYSPLEALHQRILFAKTEQEADSLLQIAEHLELRELRLSKINMELVYFDYALAMYRQFNQWTKAISYFQKTIDVNQNYVEFTRTPSLWSYIYLADIAVKQEHYVKALSICRKVLPQTQALDDIEMQRDLHSCLSKVFFHTGQPDSAYLHLRQATLLRDSIENTSNDKDLMRVHMRYVFEQEQQIQLLQQEQEQAAIAAQLQQQRLLLWGAGLGLLLLGGLAFAFYRNFRLKQRAADALGQANAALAAEQEKLLLSNAKLRRFSGVVSHDILSNLDLILSTGNVLVGDQPKKENLSQYYSLSQRTSRHLKDYCLGLLEEALRMPEAETAALSDPMPVVHQILARFGPALRAANFQVALGELSPSVLSAALVEQIFQNLISNALRHAAVGPSPLLRIAEESDRLGRQLWVVEDSGPGVPAGQRELIFSPQVKAEGSEGQHVGLSLLRAGLREQGVDIWVEEREGGGARFVVG